MISAILWDLDGTLVDSEPTHGLAFQKAVQELNLNISSDEHEDLLGKSEHDVHELVVRMGAKLSLEQWRELQWKHYHQLAADINPCSGISHVIDRLAESGVDMAVVSNSSRKIVDLNLSVTGLADRFSLSISRDDVRNGKPDPEGYLNAAAKLGHSPEQCIVIEDSLPGVSSGVAAGMTTLYVPQSPGTTDDSLPNVVYVPPDASLASALTQLGIFSN